MFRVLSRAVCPCVLGVCFSIRERRHCDSRRKGGLAAAHPSFSPRRHLPCDVDATKVDERGTAVDARRATAVSGNQAHGVVTTRKEATPHRSACPLLTRDRDPITGGRGRRRFPSWWATRVGGSFWGALAIDIGECLVDSKAQPRCHRRAVREGAQLDGRRGVDVRCWTSGVGSKDDIT